MKTEKPPQENAKSGEAAPGFLAGMILRIDKAMKAAAEKRTQQPCCSPKGGKGGPGKGGTCC